LDIK
jgi:hypothetical protein